MLKLTVALAALVVAVFLMPFGRGNAAPNRAQFDNTFTLDNYSTLALGDVTIVGNGGQTIIDVPGQGTFDTTISYTATSVIVNGQTIDYPDSAVVTLSDGSLVTLGWQSPDLVEVGNKDAVNKPVQ